MTPLSLPALQAAVEQTAELYSEAEAWSNEGPTGTASKVEWMGHGSRLAVRFLQETEAIVNAIKPLLRLWEALEWAMAPNPRYEGRHRTEPRCNVFMPMDASCDCGYVAARAALDALSPKGEDR